MLPEVEAEWIPINVILVAQSSRRTCGRLGPKQILIVQVIQDILIIQMILIIQVIQIIQVIRILIVIGRDERPYGREVEAHPRPDGVEYAVPAQLRGRDANGDVNHLPSCVVLEVRLRSYFVSFNFVS